MLRMPGIRETSFRRSCGRQRLYPPPGDIGASTESAFRNRAKSRAGPADRSAFSAAGDETAWPAAVKGLDVEISTQSRLHRRRKSRLQRFCENDQFEFVVPRHTLTWAQQAGAIVNLAVGLDDRSTDEARAVVAAAASVVEKHSGRCDRRHWPPGAGCRRKHRADRANTVTRARSRDRDGHARLTRSGQSVGPCGPRPIPRFLHSRRFPTGPCGCTRRARKGRAEPACRRRSASRRSRPTQSTTTKRWQS